MSNFGLDPGRAPAPVRASEEPIIRFFSWHDAHPIALCLVLMKRFGPEFLDWEPSVLRRVEIQRAFNATGVSDLNWNKIQAVRTALLATSPWHEWHVFEKVIHGLNNNIVDPDTEQRCSVAQLMAGIDMLHELDDEQSWSPEVAGYVAACALEDGVVYLPPPLEFAQNALSEPSYLCRTCKNIDYDDLKDGRCDVCTGRFTHDRALKGEPAQNIPSDLGSSITRFMKRDPAPVRTLFEAWQAHRPVSVKDDDPTEVQASKLVVAYDYMMKRRRELDEQLRALENWVSK